MRRGGLAQGWLRPEPKLSGKSIAARQVQGQGGRSVYGSGFRTAQCLVRYRHSYRGTGHKKPYGLAQANIEGRAGSHQVRLARAVKTHCTQQHKVPTLRNLTPRVFSSLSATSALTSGWVVPCTSSILF